MTLKKNLSFNLHVFKANNNGRNSEFKVGIWEYKKIASEKMQPFMTLLLLWTQNTKAEKYKNNKIDTFNIRGYGRQQHMNLT